MLLTRYQSQEDKQINGLLMEDRGEDLCSSQLLRNKVQFSNERMETASK